MRPAPPKSTLTVGMTTSVTSASGISMVTCKTHNRQRMAKYCAAKPVKNADGEVLRFTYTCLPDNDCTTKDGGPMGQGGNNNNGTAPKDFSLAARLYQQTGRYYDLSKCTGGIESSEKKVCFCCGQEGHERPTCPNQLCRVCHQSFGGPNSHHTPHKCVAVSPSPFVILLDTTAEDMKDVRCTLCRQYGHFDCATTAEIPNYQPSCSYCGLGGHHAFRCPSIQYPDRWEEYQEKLASTSRLPVFRSFEPDNSRRHHHGGHGHHHEDDYGRKRSREEDHHHHHHHHHHPAPSQRSNDWRDNGPNPNRGYNRRY